MMMIKDFGARVEKAWEGLRPVTKKMLVGAMQTSQPPPKQKFAYDAQSDWELSRLLTALDEQAGESEAAANPAKLDEIRQLASTCAGVLQSQTESAEVFIQLTERALLRHDYKKVDELADALFARFSAAEMCEIARQAEFPAIRALAYEALALMPPSALAPLLEDSLYFEIARNALEQQAFEFDSDEARHIIERSEFEDLRGD
jgi:hypothetical protein